MTIDDELTPRQNTQNLDFKVIAGGRAAIERAALNAVFSSVGTLPELLERLARPEGFRLRLVTKDEAAR